MCKHLNCEIIQYYETINELRVTDGIPEITGTNIDSPDMKRIVVSCDDCDMVRTYYAESSDKWPAWLHEYVAWHPD